MRPASSRSRASTATRLVEGLRTRGHRQVLAPPQRRTRCRRWSTSWPSRATSSSASAPATSPPGPTPCRASLPPQRPGRQQDRQRGAGMMAARPHAPRTAPDRPPAAGARPADGERCRWPTSPGSASAARPRCCSGRPTPTTCAHFLAGSPADVPVTVIGVGSNLLVRDGGVPGVVIRLGRGFADISVRRPEIAAGAAALDLNVALAARDAGIAGLEFLSGIPGTIGGALRMNAGAYGRELKDVVVAADSARRAGHAAYACSREDLGLTYRHSAVPEDWIFVSAVLRGHPGDHAAIAAACTRSRRRGRKASRSRTRTGGSTFANPPGEKAWELIDRRRLPGPDASAARMVSEKHCNFLINTGTATAADLEWLGEEVRRRVYETAGIQLRWEIRRIGVPAPKSTAQEAAMSKHVAVLSRRLVRRARGIAGQRRRRGGALEERGFTRHPIDVSRDLDALLAALTPRPDVVFNALHGRWRRGRHDPGRARHPGHPLHPFRRAGLGDRDGQADRQAPARQRRRPLAQGHASQPADRCCPATSCRRPTSSSRTTKAPASASRSSVRATTDIRPMPRVGTIGETVLVEQYIPGRELTVAVMGDRALAVTEIRPHAGFYDYSAKYTDGRATHLFPAPLRRRSSTRR